MRRRYIFPSVLAIALIALVGAGGYYAGRSSQSIGTDYISPTGSQSFQAGIGGGPIPTTTMQATSQALTTNSTTAGPIQGVVQEMSDTSLENGTVGSLTVHEELTPMDINYRFTIHPETIIVDENNNPVDIDYLQNGSQIVVNEYTPTEGAFKATAIQITRK